MKFLLIIILFFLSQCLYSQSFFNGIQDSTIKKSLENLILSPEFSDYSTDNFLSDEKSQLLSTYNFIWCFSRSVFDSDLKNINFDKLKRLHKMALTEIDSNNCIAKTKLKYFMDGLLGIAYAYSGSYWKAKSIASEALDYFRSEIKNNENDFDSKLPVGLELYYKGNLPFIFRIFFRGGDVDQGMKLVSSSYNNGLFSNVFAGMLLYNFYFSEYYGDRNKHTKEILYNHILDFTNKYKTSRYLGNLVYFHHDLKKPENEIITLLNSFTKHLKYGFSFEIVKAKGLYYFYSKNFDLSEHYLEKSYSLCNTSQKLNIAYLLAQVSKKLENETKLQKYKLYIKENDKEGEYEELLNTL